MRKKLIYDLLKFALSDDKANFDVFKDVSAVEWTWAFEVLSMHGVSPVVSSALEKLPLNLRPPKEVLLKFIMANMAAHKSFAKLKGLVEKMDGLMNECDLKCLLLKGFSLSECYPAPELRKFVDIDLYAPGAESNVDESFIKKGVTVDTSFYRHSHFHVNGVLVENHHCLLDVRGRKMMAILDADLKDMALRHLDSFDGPGLYYPDAMFSLIFNLHHAMSHFIYEGISFKFLVDWIFFLRNGIKHLTTDQMAASLNKHGLLKFAAVMSEVSVKHLGLAVEDVPECIRVEMTRLKPKTVTRFIDDLFRPYEPSHKKNLFAERVNNVRRIIQASWKPKEFLGQSAFGFVWDKFVPILMGRKFEAD